MNPIITFRNGQRPRCRKRPQTNENGQDEPTIKKIKLSQETTRNTHNKNTKIENENESTTYETEDDYNSNKNMKNKCSRIVHTFSSTIAFFISNKNIIERHKRFCSKPSAKNKHKFRIKRLQRINCSVSISGKADESKQLKNDDEINLGMINWSGKQWALWNNRQQNPEAYYYQFNAGGNPKKKGGWDMNEHKLFMERTREYGINGQWGIFSKEISGRVGYQCEDYYQDLMQKGWIKHFCYDVSVNTHGSRFSKNVPDEIAKYSFIVLKDPSKTFVSVPYYYPSDEKLWKYLQHIRVYKSTISNHFKTEQEFCEFLCKCNNVIFYGMARIIFKMVWREKAIGWISEWAADILAPLMCSNEIEICDISMNELKIKKVSGDKEWPEQLKKHIHPVTECC